MRLYLCLAMAVLVAGTPAAAVNAENVTFQSGSYADFRQLLARESPAATATATLTIAATLRFPDQARERYPAVVIVHTIAGYQEANEGWHAAQFRKAGFATLTYDSPAARTMREASGFNARGGPPWGSAVAEAYAALRLLARDPRIDASRIAIVGFSFGGEVAHLAAFERVRGALVPDATRFAAHIAYYPAGVHGAVAGPGAYTGAPVLLLLGDKDDNLPIAKAEDYLAYAKAGGAAPPIEVSIYPGAYHAWTVPNPGAPRFYRQYASTRKCPYLLLGPPSPVRLVDGRERPIDLDALRACLKEGQGYAMAYDAAVRARSTEDAVAFLRRQP
jgi:dienelactone hydrolase